MKRLAQRVWQHKKVSGAVVLSLVAVAVVGIFHAQIIDGFITARDSLVRTFAFGFVPTLLGAVALAFAVWKRRHLLVRRYWNRWAGALVGTVVIWGGMGYLIGYEGILNEVSLGGEIGQAIKGPSDILGAVRLFALAALAITIAAPIGTLWWLRRSARFTGRASRRAARALPVVGRGARAAGRTVARGFSFLRRRKPEPATISVQEAPVPRQSERSSAMAFRRQQAMQELAPRTPISQNGDGASDELPAAPRPKPAPTASAPPPVTARQPSPAAAPSDVERPVIPYVSPAELARWAAPPVTVLAESPPGSHEPGIDTEATSELIENTLADYGIEVSVSEVKPGPTVTMFGLVPGWVRRNRQSKGGDAPEGASGRTAGRSEDSSTRVKVDNILAREKDLALALAAPSLRIEAPIPGASLVGIEVPNSKPAMVNLRDVMETDEYRSTLERSKLTLALGTKSGGETAVADLARMPHLLIAGSTGSGKSVCVNTVITSIIMQTSPWEARLLMIDPKRVELTPYNGIPHLIVPVIVEVDMAVQALRGMISEMMARYKLLEEAGSRNIESYNRDRAPHEKMPFIVIAVDELADLMMSASKDIEHSIVRLAQLGRATGIHLVVATQRPSVDVVTGLIKANFPGRIAFAVASQVDSRTILDSAGAENLLGRGDMLFQPSDAPKPTRVQGAFLSDREIGDLVSHWRKQSGPLPPPISLESAEAPRESGHSDGESGDDLLDKAWDLATQHNRLSTSLLQRRLRIGYPRAARLMDLLEEEGVVGPGEPGKSRDVLVSRGRRPGAGG